MAKLTGEVMAVMEPLPRRDAPSCRGAIFCARTFIVLSDSELRMDYMAVPWIYLPNDAVVFLWSACFFSA